MNLGITRKGRCFVFSTKDQAENFLLKEKGGGHIAIINAATYEVFPCESLESKKRKAETQYIEAKIIGDVSEMDKKNEEILEISKKIRKAKKK